MVYVVAAYSLTISVLVLYGVLLQHRARVARARLAVAHSGGPVGAQDPELARGFNLGAALLAPFWAWSHGLRAAGAIFLASCGALVLAEASGLRQPALLLASMLIGAALFLGTVGNRIALSRAGGAGSEALASQELRWAIAGAVLYTIILPWACYFWLSPG